MSEPDECVHNVAMTAACGRCPDGSRLVLTMNLITGYMNRHYFKDRSPQAIIRQRIKQLTADWLRDQAENGFDGFEDTILAGMNMGDEATYNLMLEEARRVADSLATPLPHPA